MNSTFSYLIDVFDEAFIMMLMIFTYYINKD